MNGRILKLEVPEHQAVQELLSWHASGRLAPDEAERVARMRRVQPWGAKARLGESRAGDVLGEMSLLDAGARFSACTTLTPPRTG